MSCPTHRGGRYHYLFRKTFTELYQQKYTTFFIILVIGITFSLPSLSYIFWKNTQRLQQYFPLYGEVTLFLKKDITSKQKDALFTTLNTTPEVEKSTYISTDQHLQNLKEYGLDESEWLKDASLPNMVILYLKPALTQEKLQAITHSFQHLAGVDQVRFELDFLQRINAISALFAKIATFCTLLMCISVLLITSHSIRAEVYAQRRHIHVMQILGATKSFIVTPFLFKGVLLVTLGSTFGCLLSFLLLQEFSKDVQNIALLFNQPFQLVNLNVREISIFILLGGLLGYFSSMFASLRYIRHLEKE